MLDGSRQMLISLALTLSDHWSAPSECSAYLSKLLSRYRRYKNFGAVTMDGKLFCSAVPFDGEFDAREQSWFRQAVTTREFSISDYQIGVHTGEPVVLLAYPVDGNESQLIGVVFAALDIQWLNRFNLGMEKDLPRGSIVAEVDERGLVLANDPDPDIWAGRPVIQNALAEAFRSGSKGMLTLTGPDGQPWFYAFSLLRSNLRSQKVHLLLGVPQSAVFEEANRLLVHNLILLGAVTILILLTAWFGIDLFVLRQVKAMLATTRKLTAGDLSVRTGIPRRAGELNELAGAFDDMATTLEIREAQRQKAEQDLRSSREELRNLASHMESVREEERTRLAREIHDELGQAMTALKMDIAWLNRRLDPKQEPLHEKTRSMEDLIDATIRTVQRLSGELRPGLLDDLGLSAAIEWQSEEFQKRTGVPCAVCVDLQDTTLSREHTTALFRVFQETLTNVIRHAQATRVGVRLQAAEDQLVLEVKDNGRGITEKEIEEPQAFGLIGMRERVLAFKGKFAISGRPGRGTTVTVTIPLDKEK
jgi:signal transduction histidine kinase